MTTPFVVTESTNNDLLFDPVVDGERKGRGYDPSFIDQGIKQEMKALPSSFKIIPRSEWSARCKEQKEQKSSLYHLKMTTMADGKPHQSLDQNGEGYCWEYGHCAIAMYVRAAAHMPYVRFSPHASACVIKKFRDEGGWCGLAHRFSLGKDPAHPTKGGFMPESLWPQKSMNPVYNTQAAWDQALKYIPTEDVYDPLKSVYDQQMREDLIATLLLTNRPVQADYNEWGHSGALISWEEFEPGAFGPRFDNSWTPGWGENGTAVIKKWDVDGAVALLVLGGDA